MGRLPTKLSQKIEARKASNALRSLPSKEGLVDFSSNDYLGFAQLDLIEDGARKFLEDFKIVQHSATGSRLLSGNHKMYTAIEQELAEWFEAAVLVFNSGYDANLGLFGAVLQRGDVVLYDELCHASIRDGIRLGNAKAFKFKHNDIDDLRAMVNRIRLNSDKGEIYVATESVFSMDGDSPGLDELIALCDLEALNLIVDEAHAVGVYGKGLVQEGDLHQSVFARIVTFGKALGSHGAAVIGSTALKQYLVNFARSFIYTTALPPHGLARIMAAFDHLKGNIGLKAKNLLHQNIKHFKLRVAEYAMDRHFLDSHSPIQGVLIADNQRAKACEAHCMANGFDVRAILSPTVPQGNERLRICLHSFNSSEEIDNLIAAIARFCNG